MVSGYGALATHGSTHEETSMLEKFFCAPKTVGALVRL